MANNQKTSAAAKPENMDSSKYDKAKANEDMNAKTDVQDAKQAVKKTANEAVGQAKDKAVGLIDQKKQNLASGLNDVADSIRKVGENLREGEEQTGVGKTVSQYGDSLAGAVESFSGYIEDARFNDLKRDLEDFAHRQPLVFVGGAFALGLLAARFLKSSDSRGTSHNKYSPNKNRLRGKTGRGSA